MTNLLSQEISRIFLRYRIQLCQLLLILTGWFLLWLLFLLYPSFSRTGSWFLESSRRMIYIVIPFFLMILMMIMSLACLGMAVVVPFLPIMKNTTIQEKERWVSAVIAAILSLSGLILILRFNVEILFLGYRHKINDELDIKKLPRTRAAYMISQYDMKKMS